MSASPDSSNKAEEVEKVLPKALPEDIKQILNSWKSVVDAIPDKSIKAVMSRAKLNITEDNGNLVILYDERKATNDETLVVNFIRNDSTNVAGILEETIETILGKKVSIVLRNTNNADSGHILDPRAEFKSNVMEKMNFPMSVE